MNNKQMNKKNHHKGGAKELSINVEPYKYIQGFTITAFLVSIILILLLFGFVALSMRRIEPGMGSSDFMGIGVILLAASFILLVGSCGAVAWSGANKSCIEACDKN